MLRKSTCFILVIAITIPALRAASSATFQHATSATVLAGPKILTASEATPYLPSTVFFRGQSAPIQSRNSGGVQFTKDALLLVALVDTSGYSSAVQEKYQAYLITETTIDIEGHQLPPGAYGCGFVTGSTFIVMDIGGHDLFSVHSTKDTALHRPTPLQVLPVPTGTGYRLYAGRDYIEFTQTPPETNTATPVHP